jgi:hypothetical protein
MANMKYAVGQPFQTQSHLEGDFHGLTTASLQDETAATGYPVTNVCTEHLAKSFRAQGWTRLEVSFDLGSTSASPTGVLIEGLNWNDQDIQLERGITAGLGTTVGDPVTPVRNKRTGRYGCFIEIDPALDVRYWGFSVPATGSAVTSAAYTTGWEVGRVTWVQEDMLNTMEQNWQLPVGQSTAFQSAQRVLAGGKMESKASSDAYLCVITDFTGDIGEYPVLEVDLGLREVI